MASYVWTGALSADWNTSGNWDIAGSRATTVPGSGDTVTISAGTKTDTITGAGALDSQTMNLASSGAGLISLTGDFYTGYSSGALNFGGLVELSGFIDDYGSAAFSNGATLDGGALTVAGASTFGAGFTVENANLALSTSSTATLTTLTLIGAATLSGNITATNLSDSAATSLTLGTGAFDVSGSSSSSPVFLPTLTIAGDATLEGTFNSTGDPVSSLTVDADADLYLDAGDSLVAATATFDQDGGLDLTDGTLTVSGNASFGSSLSVTGAGSFTVDGTLSSDNGSIYATDSSRVEIGALNGMSGGVTLNADATSTIEIGNQDVGAAGSITIDSGVSFTESGTFEAPVIVVNGAVTVAANAKLELYGTSSRGLTGSGTINIDAGSNLTLYDVDPGTSDTVTIDFAQSGGQLWLPSGDFDALGNFKPLITGYGATEVIEYYGTATSASYASNYLSLYDGANLVADFDIGAGYAGDTFTTVAISDGYTQVDLAGAPNAAPAGTSTSDVYSWVGPVAGFWNATSNWDDKSTGQDPAAVAPGKDDIITIDAAANGAAQVVIGSGNAYSLTLGGETLLEGQFNIGAGGFTESQSASAVLYTGSALNVTGAATFNNDAGATLDGGAMTVSGAFNGGNGGQYILENGGSLQAGRLNDYFSSFYVYAGDTLAVAGNSADGTTDYGGSEFFIYGGVFTVGGTFVTTGDSIVAQSGGRVQLSALAEDSFGDGVTLYVSDSSSSIEIGTAGGVAAGTITIDSGNSVTEYGYFNAYTIVDAGTLQVGASQSLTVNGVFEDEGGLTIGAGATMSLTGALQLSNNVTIDAGGSLSQYYGVTGTGTIAIDAGGQLSLGYGVSAGSVTVAFAGAGAQLALTYSDLNASGAFQPTITGFGAADVIDFQPYSGTITSVSYSAGVLSLLDGATVVATLSLKGTYTNTFSVLPIGEGYYQIDYLGSGTHPVPAGTSTVDSYTWVGPVAGDWNALTNWDDTTAGRNPAAKAPGQSDLVTIGLAAGGAAQVLVGNGNAYSLTLDGETLLDGTFSVGAGGLSLANYAIAYLYSGSALNIAGAAVFGNYAGVTLNGGGMTLTGAITNANGNPFLIENGGTLTAATLSDYSSNYTVDAGSSLNVNSVADGAGDTAGSNFYVFGGAFTVTTTFTSTDDSINAADGGTVQIASLVINPYGEGVTLSADATSSIELGDAGGAAAGAITIDAGTTVAVHGIFSTPTIVDAGTLNVETAQSLTVNGAFEDEGGLSLGTGAVMSIDGVLELSNNVTVGFGGKLAISSGITGAGVVTIDANAIVSISGAPPSSGGVTLAFAGAGAELALTYADLNASNVFQPTITGFGAAEVIDFKPDSGVINAVSYSTGVLSLLDGGAIVATLNLTGTYTNTFSVLPISEGYYQIDYLGGGTNSAPSGTTTADYYTWVGPVAGFWNATSNWDDTSTGSTPAANAPGQKDLVTINKAEGGAAQVIVGNGNAYSLTLDGETLLDGTFSIKAGGLSVADDAIAYLYGGSALNIAGNAGFNNYAGVTLNGGAMTLTGTGTITNTKANPFLLENGGTLTAVALDDYSSTYTIDASSTLKATNVSDGASGSGGSTFDVYGGAFDVKGTFKSTDDNITAEFGGTVQLANLAEDSFGNGVTLAVDDGGSSIEIGTTGGAAAGSITIDAGKTVTEQGEFEAPSVIVSGTLVVGTSETLDISGATTVNGSVSIGTGATLYLAAGLSGAGTVTIGAGATLTLPSDSRGGTTGVTFSGAGGQLAIDTTDLNGSNVFSPGISGFAAADTIDFTDASVAITSAQYAAGELDLYSGSAVEATLNLSGTYANFFSVVELGSSGTYQVNYEGAGPKAGAPAGTTSGDAYQWVGPVSGVWSAKANWDDTSQGQDPAKLAPGADDSVTIGPAANGEAQILDGAGNAYGLTIEGETMFFGAFKVEGTGARGGFTVTDAVSIGAVVAGAGVSLNVTGDATFDNYTWALINGGSMAVGGTIYGNYGSDFTFENGGSLTVSQIVDYSTEYVVASGGTVVDSGNASDGGTGAGASTYYVNGGSLTVKGIFVTTNDTVEAQDGGKVRLASLQQDLHDDGVSLVVYDSVSSIEIGAAGGAAGGAITIDSTSSVTEWGTFDAATIVDNGSLAVAASQTLYVEGSLSGVGNVTVNAGSSLYLFGATTKAANTITFSGAGGTLYLLGEYGLPNGMTLNGWGTGDNIEVLNVTDAAYSAGKLVLYKNGVQVGYFKVASSYANDSFDVVPQSNGYSNITLGPSWLNAVSGNFATAADWSNGAVPGVSDSAAISTAGIYTVSVTASTSLLSIEEADAGATLSIAVGDALTLDGASNFSGAVVGNGELNLTGGVTTFNKGAAVSVATLALSATGANLTIAEALSYAGAFQAGAGSSVTVSGGNLTLTGPAAFTNAAVNGGAYTLFARGATSLTDGLAIGGTLAFETVGSLTHSGGTVTDGDAAGDIAEIRIASTGTWDITDASGIALGTSTASTIVNDGLFEKTAGTGESTIAPAFDNAHNLIVSAGTLDLTGAVTGTGTDTIQGSATELEFDSTLAKTQTVDFSATGETLNLTDALGYGGSHIGGFIAGDNVDLTGAWTLLSFKENAGGTLGALTLQSGANDVALEFVGKFTQSSFSINSGSVTVIGHT